MELSGWNFLLLEMLSSKNDLLIVAESEEAIFITKKCKED